MVIIIVILVPQHSSSQLMAAGKEKNGRHSCPMSTVLYKDNCMKVKHQCF